MEAIGVFKTNKQVAFSVISKYTGIKDKQDIDEYYTTLTKNFLQDNPSPTLKGIKTVLDQLSARDPRVREIKPEDLIETRFLRDLTVKGGAQ